MDNVEKYLNFIRNYGAACTAKGTDSLAPSELGDVLIQTAVQNNPDVFNQMRRDLESMKD